MRRELERLIDTVCYRCEYRKRFNERKVDCKKFGDGKCIHMSNCKGFLLRGFRHEPTSRCDMYTKIDLISWADRPRRREK